MTPAAPSTRYVVHLTDGSRISASEAEPLPNGWLRVTMTRTRPQYDESRNECYLAVEGREHRTYPPTAVAFVREPLGGDGAG